MKKIFLLTFCLAGVSLFAQPAWSWAYSAGGPGNEIGTAISTSTTGASYVTGYFHATAAFDVQSVTSAGGSDIFIAKYNSTGTCLWVKSSGGTGDDYGYGIDIDAAGNCYVAGQKNFYVRVEKYDASGNRLWVDSTAGGEGRAIATDAAGNSWVTGFLGNGTHIFGSYTLFGSGGFVAKYDPNGNVLFATGFGTTGGIEFNAITIDAAGNAYTTGFLRSTETVSTQTLTPVSAQDLLVIKVNAAGNFVWLDHTPLVAGGSLRGRAICEDGQGNLYVGANVSFGTVYFANDTFYAGNFGFGEILLLKYDTAGNQIWGVISDAQTSGNPSNFVNAIDCDWSGQVFITGSFHDNLLFDAVPMNTLGIGTNVYVAKFNPLGVCQYSLATSGASSWGWGISATPTATYIAGHSKAPVVFGADTTFYYGAEDAFIAKIEYHPEVGVGELQPEKYVSLFQSGAQQFQLLLGEKTLNGDPLRFVLYDMTGRIVKTVSLSATQTQIGCSDLAKGIYSWSVENVSERIASGKLVN